MADQKTSQDSIAEANRDRSKFSGHGDALGAAGEREASTDADCSVHLRKPGDCIAINPPANGFGKFTIGAEWDNMKVQKSGLMGKLFKKTMSIGVDIDLGCMYELQDGSRGAIQAFGNKFGSFDAAPFIALSGDERTGNKSGLDELIVVNGQHWDKIKRIVMYIYIYKGAQHWGQICPQLVLDVPGQEDLYVTLAKSNDALDLCAIGQLENVRNGIVVKNLTEYFPGHEEMDRALGFGLNWAEGTKR